LPVAAPGYGAPLRLQFAMDATNARLTDADGMVRCGASTYTIVPPDTATWFQRKVLQVETMLYVTIEKSAEGPSETGLVLRTHPQSNWTTVHELEPSGLAFAAGLRLGDRIFTVDGEPCRDAEDAMARISAAGGAVRVGMTHFFKHGTFDWAVDRYKYYAGALMCNGVLAMGNPLCGALAWYTGYDIRRRGRSHVELARELPRVRCRLCAFMLLAFVTCCSGYFLAAMMTFGGWGGIDFRRGPNDVRTEDEGAHIVLILALMSIWGTFPAGLLLFGSQVLGITFTVAKFRDPKTGLYPGEDVGEGAAAVVVAQAEA